MIIRRAELYRYYVPLHTPFKTAVREVSHIHDIVLKLDCEQSALEPHSLVAYGSAPDTWKVTGDSHQSIIEAFESVLKPLIINREINTLDEFKTLLQEIHSANGAGTNAKALVDIALFDAMARKIQMPLNHFLRHMLPVNQANLPINDTLKTDYTISVNDTKTMCTDIDIAIARGYRCLKVKIGGEAYEDLERLEAIYEHVQALPKFIAQQPPLSLRLDVNQAWDAQTTISIMQKLEAKHIDFELVEQPVHQSDIDGLAHIKANIQTPVMADESAFSLQQVKDLHKKDAVDIVNIKLMKTGGLYSALQIVEYCRNNQIRCMIGCMLEGSIAVAAAAHLASAHSDVISLIDLDGPTLGQYDPVQGASEFKDARISVNLSHGLGISDTQVFEPWHAQNPYENCQEKEVYP